jgi:hypothetical protein
VHRYSGFLTAVIFCITTPTAAAESDGIRTAGEILRIVLPAAAAGISLGKDDGTGSCSLRLPN